MKGHNQNKYLHNYIKSSNPTHAGWTECRIKLGRKDLALQLSLLNVPVCQGPCQPGGVLGHSVMGRGQGLSFLVCTGCYGLFHTSHRDKFNPRILLGMPGLPEGFQ